MHIVKKPQQIVVQILNDFFLSFRTSSNWGGALHLPKNDVAYGLLHSPSLSQPTRSEIK